MSDLFPVPRERGLCLRWFEMPSTEVELHHRHKPLYRIVNLGHWEQRLRMGHKATHTHESAFPCPQTQLPQPIRILYALGNPLQHAPRLQDEGRQHDPAQVGAWP